MNKPVYAPEAKASRADRTMLYDTLESSLFEILVRIAIQLGLLILLAVQAKAQCSMFCDDHVQVALDGDCAALITYDAILEDPDNPLVCYPNGPSNYAVFIMDRQNRIIPTNPIVTSAYIGQSLMVKVKHLPSGNSCWGTISVVDKMPPLMQCPPDTLIACTILPDSTITGIPIVSDCSGFSLSHFDRIIPNSCQDTFRRIARIWTAKDTYGNRRTCEQTIFYKRPELDDVVFPQNHDDIKAPAFLCDAVAVDPGLILPSHTGVPTIDGAPIVNGGICTVGHTFTDRRVDDCDGSYSILRTWTVADWCSGQVRRHVQLIKVKDKTPPVIQCAAILYAQTNSSTVCEGSVQLPAVTVFDNCSSTIFVKIHSSFGTVTGNGGLLHNVPPGNHLITYTASDGCGNTSTFPVQLIVTDGIAPVAICRSLTTVTLSSDGTALLPARTLDEGSYDNCCLERFEVRRMDEPDSLFSPSITLTCADTRSPATLILRVWDCYGNENRCMVRVTVQEKIAPVISCPPDITLDCFADVSDLHLTGKATATDGCGIDSIYYVDQRFQNTCQSGHLIRTWIARDFAGNTRSCDQRIELENRSQIQVSFPLEYSVMDCLPPVSYAPDSLPSPYDRPVIIGQACGLVGVNFEDRLFQTAGAGCYKIMRTWTVIDWCLFDESSGAAGKFIGIQVIEVKDQNPPFLHCPADTVFLIDSSDCATTVRFPAPMVTDCSSNILIQVDSDLGVGSVHTSVNPGTYSVTYTATDGCGNTSQCSIRVEVRDGIRPTAFCHGNLTLNLPPGGEISIAAENFDAGSSDNCTPFDDLLFRIERVRQGIPPNLPSASDSLLITCDDFQNSPVNVRLWVGDAAGNWDFCALQLIVQDNQNACGNLRPRHSLGGAISLANGQMVDNVEVKLDGNLFRTPSMTDLDGHFLFQNIPAGQALKVIPEKQNDLLLGLSTWDLILIQRHILGTEPFDSPLKIIAADINGDQSIDVADLKDLRFGLLRVIPRFPGNSSFRFLPDGHIFQDPDFPFPFPERIEVEDLQTDEMGLNFKAIKVGDVDQSIRMGNLDVPEDRTVVEKEIFLIRWSPLSQKGFYKISVSPVRSLDLLGCQMAFRFDPAALEIIEILENETIKRSNFGLANENDHWLIFSWSASTAHTFQLGSPFIELVVRTPDETEPGQFFHLDPAVLHAECYTASDDRHDILLKQPSESITSFEVAVAPNPFSQSTTILISSPDTGQVKWACYDLSGRKMADGVQMATRGSNRIDLNGIRFSKGIYFLKIMIGENTRYIRLVKA